VTRSTPATPARRRTALGALVGAALLTGLGALSACSAGQITQTDTQVAAIPGVDAESADGQIAIRNAVIVYASKYPAGATIPLDLRLFNNSGKQARLIGATTTKGGTVVLVGGASATPSPPAPTSASASPSVNGSRRPSGSPSAPASPSPTVAPSPTSAGSSKIDIALPPNAPQVLAPSGVGGYLAIVGRSEELRPGKTASITLTFAYEGGGQTTVTIDLPVSTPLSPPPRQSPTIRVGE
jgi:hypothetical protein